MTFLQRLVHPCRPAVPLGSRRRGPGSPGSPRPPVPWVDVLEPRVLLSGAPTLEAGIPIQDGITTLAVDNVSVPAVVDWNNDGKKDLLVGQRTNGNIRIYTNQGSDANPAFDGWSYVASGGEAISTTYT